MAGYKETPRQKMIGMMYLVLTALLALNVSVEILNAFLVVNKSMETTNKSFAGKIDWTLAKFKMQNAINPEKVGPFYNKANNASKLAEDMIKYIESIKLKVIMVSEKVDSATAVKEHYLVDYRPAVGGKDSIAVKSLQLHTVSTKDKYDETTHYFMGDSQDGSKGKSKELKDRLIAYKKAMMDFVDPKARESFQVGLDTDGPFFDADSKKQNWEQHNFYHTILAADITILNKIINEIQSLEFDVVNHLLASISEEDYKFDEVAARVVPQTRYVFQGEEYNAEVFVAAYDTKSSPEVFVLEGADTITEANIKAARPIEGVGGLVNLKLSAGSEGIKKYAGVIKIKTPTGATNQYYFKDEYVVAKPSLTISATKMNVFYIGVDNPVSISVPGIPTEKIKPAISIGTLKRGANNDWIVTMGKDAQGKKAQISVSTTDGAKSKSMGSVEFRVKRVPDPTAYVGATSGGSIAKDLLLSSPIIPRMPPDFDFQLDFIVTAFTFVSTQSGDIFTQKVTGNQFPESVRNLSVRLNQDRRSGLKILWPVALMEARKLGVVSINIR